MAVLFLPIVINNIPPPINKITGTTMLLGVYWLLLVFAFHPKILFSKFLKIIYISVLVFYIGSLTIWDKIIYSSAISFKWILLDYFGAFLSIVMYLYFIKSRDYKGIAIVSLSGLIFILITSITSIISLNFYPDAVRQLSSGSAGQNDVLYGKMGIAGYTYWTSIVYLFPILVYFIKDKYFKTSQKWIVLLFMIIIFFSLIKSQITTALVLAMFFTIFSFLNRKNLRTSSLILITFTILAMFMLNNYIANFFYYISDITNSELLKLRLFDVGRVFEIQDYSTVSGETYFSQSRLSRISISFENFLMNPLFGGGNSGGHSTWIDKLGVFGIIGLIPWLVIFKQQVKLNLTILDEYFKPFYLLSIISCVLLGILTTTANSTHSGVIIFFVVPGLFFSRYLLQKKS